ATFGLAPESCEGRSKGRRRDADARAPEGCFAGCVAPGRGLRVVAPPGRRPTLRLCEPDHLECGRMRTPFEYASTICGGLRERVQRLSGLGMQLSAAAHDPDRPCRVACQDADLQRRFYLVNGETGWFPPGTDCGRGERQAFCVNGMCLDFGPDGSLQADVEFIIPLLNRTRRAAWNDVRDHVLTRETKEQSYDKSSTSPVDLHNAVYSNLSTFDSTQEWENHQFTEVR
ncbi:A disintegrin and metalloproteinase with thrombospondin motifs 18, partial [Gryllus bimaculatus]